VTDDAADQAGLDAIAVEQFSGDMRFVLTVVTDADGDGLASPMVDRWDIDVRAVVASDEVPEGTVSLGRVTALTVRAPEDADDMATALDEAGAGVEYLAAVRAADQPGGFADLFATAAGASGQEDLLIIEHVAVREPFRNLPEIVGLIVGGVRLGPAGRTSAFVLADPTAWDTVAVRHGRRSPHASTAVEQLSRAGFQQWAGTSVLALVNADLEEAMRQVEGVVARPGGATSRTTPIVVGDRSDELWLGPVVEAALGRPSVAVPFDLPPMLPDEILEGLPEDVHGIDADEETGTVTVETHDDVFEIVGRPGNAPQLVGAATNAPAATQQWLREVHSRYWKYWPNLHDQIHERLDGLRDGVLDLTDEDAPHLHMPDLVQVDAPWPGSGTIELNEAEDGPDDAAVYEAVLFHGDEHEHVGGVIVEGEGHVRAFLHDEWRPDFPDSDAAVTCLLTLGVEEFYTDVRHETLEQDALDVILTGGIPGHDAGN
jgi:hypothetical protein